MGFLAYGEPWADAFEALAVARAVAVARPSAILACYFWIPGHRTAASRVQFFSQCRRHSRPALRLWPVLTAGGRQPFEVQLLNCRSSAQAKLGRVAPKVEGVLMAHAGLVEAPWLILCGR